MTKNKTKNYPSTGYVNRTNKIKQEYENARANKTVFNNNEQ